MITFLIFQIRVVLYILTYFFFIVFEKINNNNKAFKYYIKDIILKLLNVKTMTNANKMTRYEFISAILHAFIAIAKNLIFQDIFIIL